MEKNNGKIVAVVALVIAVVSLSVGFAAFSATLTINDASATVKANDEFEPNVNYVSGSPKCYYTGSEYTSANELDPETLTGLAVGTASQKSWTGVSVPLTTEHKSITCVAQIQNASQYVANLRKISIADFLSCASVGAGDAAATNVDDICATVSATVKVAGSDTTTFTASNNASPNKAAFEGTSSTIAKDNGTANVELTIAYTSAVAADGDIRITVPTISLLYKTN